MQKHIKTYLNYYGICQEEARCEMCIEKGIIKNAVDIHHIIPRSKFGKKYKYKQDLIENLIGLCRDCHDKAHFRQEPYLYKDELQEIHNKNLKW